MNCREVIRKLKSLADADYLRGMSRYGVDTERARALGVSAPRMRKLAEEIGKDHKLALELWESGIHEARIVATLIEDVNRVTNSQINKWVHQADNWGVCDCCCGVVLDKTMLEKTELAWEKAIEWSEHEEEYVRRAGFVLMAALAIHDKKAADKKFLPFFKIIKRHADDERNFVKKAVNWALRQIGKRNIVLNRKAVAVAREIRKMDSRSGRWIVSDALRELTSKKVQARLRKRAS